MKKILSSNLEYTQANIFLPAQLNYLPVEIDVTGLDSNKKYTVNLQKPKGITDISIKTITVDISVDDLATKTVDGITINYRNLADDLVVQGVNDDIIGPNKL